MCQLETGFAEEVEHVAFVGLDAGLVEGVDTERVAADATGKLKEVDQLAEGVFVDTVDRDFHHGHATVDVGFDGAFGGAVVNLGQALVGQIVDAVEVLVVGGDGDGGVGLAHTNHGFHHQALALLHVLSHRVQVGGDTEAVRQQAFVFLALALAVELLPPFGQVAQVGLAAYQHLNLETFAIKGVAHGGVHLKRLSPRP